MQEAARVAIDLGAESCRVSLLRWLSGHPSIEVIHRIPNGPVRRGDSLCWPLARILAGIEEGLRIAAAAAPEGIASIGVDGWSVDYVRLAPDGTMLREPFCYRDERTSATREKADRIISPFDLYQRTGAYPLKINTMYQLLADPAAGIDSRAPWVMLPEFVLYWLSGRRVAEHTNATHTGLVNLKTGDWDTELFKSLGLPLEAAPPIVPTGTILGPITGKLVQLEAFRDTQIIAPATHDTASAIAGIPTDLSSAAYISSGTWSSGGHNHAKSGHDQTRLRRWLHEHRRGGRWTPVSFTDQQHVGAQAVHGCVGGAGAPLVDRESHPGGRRAQLLPVGVLDMDAESLMLDCGDAAAHQRRADAAGL